MRALLALLCAACSFDPAGFRANPAGGDGGPGAIDGAGLDGLPPPPDAACAATFIDLCSAGPPGGPVAVAGADFLNTDTDPRCRTYPQPGGPDACLVYATDVTLSAGASLTAVGTRPLVIASVADLRIDGLIDVSSQRGIQTGAGANYGGCPAGLAPENDLGGAAGGAGGSFGGGGGTGGTGDIDMSLGNDGSAIAGLAGAAQPSPAFVRGGCRGQDGGDEGDFGGAGGSGGDSGGGVFLFSWGAVHVGVTAVIRATGAGGGGGAVQAGGGGGGSGGFIGFEGTGVIVEGQLWIDGGGGGGGGARLSGIPISGGPGSDASTGSAPGGYPSYDAPGATGSDSPLPPGNGASSIVGAGGGGGSFGFTYGVGP